MKCRMNFQTDPISLTIIAAAGKEHEFLDAVGDGGFVDVEIAVEQAHEADQLSAPDKMVNVVTGEKINLGGCK